MSSLHDLLTQRIELEKQIEDAKRESRAAAISKVRELMAENGVTIADLGGKTSTRSLTISKGASLKGVAIAPKYKGPNGESWTGRGLQPRWLREALTTGATLEQFKIAV